MAEVNAEIPELEITLESDLTGLKFAKSLVEILEWTFVRESPDSEAEMSEVNAELSEYWNVGLEPTWMANLTVPSMSEMVRRNPELLTLGLMAAMMEKLFGRRRRNTLESGVCSSAEGTMLKAAGLPGTRVTPTGSDLTSRASNTSLVPAGSGRYIFML